MINLKIPFQILYQDIELYQILLLLISSPFFAIPPLFKFLKMLPTSWAVVSVIFFLIIRTRESFNHFTGHFSSEFNLFMATRFFFSVVFLLIDMQQLLWLLIKIFGILWFVTFSC